MHVHTNACWGPGFGAAEVLVCKEPVDPPALTEGVLLGMARKTIEYLLWAHSPMGVAMDSDRAEQESRDFLEVLRKRGF